jgi:plastocyanin/endo-1,4-beta-D-glucanase Y
LILKEKLMSFRRSFGCGLGRVLLLVGWLFTETLGAVTPYVYGMLPTSASDADLNSAYSLWKARRFKTLTCGQPMAWVDRGDGNAVSEGVAYGMLMAAYLDANSSDFAKLYNFYALKKDSHGLMNWLVPGNCAGDNGANAATDADLDVALALIRAHRRWPSEGWGAKATSVLNNIYTHMVDGCQGLKNGDTWGGCSSGANNAYNPSYFRTGYMGSFDCFEGGNRWAAVRARSYVVAGYAYNNYALPPDWVRNNGQWGQATNSGGYGYDSCRSPWTFTQDYLWWGNTQGRDWGRKIALVFGNKNWGNPSAAAADVGDDYNYLTGAKVSWNHENAFLGGAAVAFMATTHTAMLDAFYNNLVFTDNNSYYSDSLKVIYLMILTGVFQEPCYGPGPIPTATPTATPTNYAGTPTPTPLPAFGLVFEDFENGLAGGYAYGGPTQSRSAAAAHAGAYGYQVGGTLAGGGVGFNSSYADANGVVDATGAVALRFWVKSDVNIAFQVDWFEAGAPGSPVAGGDGEAWVSSTQNVSGDSTWHQIVLPLSAMSEEVYNGVCNPSYGNNTLCATTGNNTQNLSAVNKIQIKFTLGSGATVHFDDFEFVLGTQPTPTYTRTPFIGSYNQVFDDIESPLSLRLAPAPAYAGTYADTAHGASASLSIGTTDLPPSGGGNTSAGLITYNTGGASSYGAGAWLLSPYSNPSLYVDVEGAVFLGLWVKANPGTVYRLEYTEAGTPSSPTAGADGEAWQSGPITAGGGWEFIQLEVAAFSEDLYNPICNPTGATPANCASGGNGVRDFQAIASVTLKLDGNQGSGQFLFDDVVFVTSYKSPTPTRTATLAFTATPTPSPSPSPSATRTFTGTASPTPTATPSPTSSPYAGSPTDTPTAGATLTPSPWASSTFTPSASPSATNAPTVPSATATLTQTAAGPSHTPVPPTATSSPTPSVVSSPTPVSAMITDSAFTWTPEQLTVTAGTTVTWAWSGTHDVRSDDGLFNSGPPVTGGSFMFTFESPGTYRYYCSLHGGVGGVGMSGVIFVIGASTPTPSNGPPIVQTRPFPNPLSAREGRGSIRVELKGPVAGLELAVYNAAMVRVGAVDSGPMPSGWGEIALPSVFFTLPPGLYFYGVRAVRNGHSWPAPKLGRLVLLP